MSNSFYEIRFAYASSKMAKQLKRSVTGCYYVILADKHINGPFDLLSEAVEFAQSTGHTPSRYSLDIFKGG